MTTLLLLPEKPISVLPTLATNIGLNEAIALQQLHYWLVESDGGTKFGESKDGKTWVYNNYDQWKEKNFPFWSVSTIRRIFASLERQRLVNTRIEKGSQFAGGRRKWYTVNYETVYKIGSVQIEHTVCSEWTDGSVQNEPSLYTETTSETTAIAQQPNGAARAPASHSQPTPTTPPPVEVPEPDATPPQPTGPGVVESQPPRPRRKRALADRVPAAQMNPMKDAIAAAFGWDWDAMTSSEAGQIQKAARELCRAKATPDEVPRVYAYCAQNYEVFGPPALTTNLSKARAKFKPQPMRPVLRFPKHPDPHCRECEGHGMTVGDDGRSVPCRTCLAAEDAALAAEEAADEAAA
jgi:hypothetical protein